MVLPLFKEKRLDVRTKLTGLLPGRIRDSLGRGVSARPVNVSKGGMGIVTKNILEVGTELVLQVGKLDVVMVVKWVEPDFAKHNILRYGLMVQDGTIDLEQIFLDSGCIC